MYRRILVPLDGSEQAEKVLPLACTIADASEAEVVLLRVVEYPFMVYPPCYSYPPVDPDIVKIIENKKNFIHHEVMEYLDRIASMLVEAGVEATAEVGEGPVVEVILTTALYQNIDLIVLSGFGEGGGNQWKMGSVADRVLQEAATPVILMRSTIQPLSTDSSLIHRVMSSV
jgi:nucleotide-binding universal stress UspA family protein